MSNKQERIGITVGTCLIVFPALYGVGRYFVPLWWQVYQGCPGPTAIVTLMLAGFVTLMVTATAAYWGDTRPVIHRDE